MTKTLRWVWLLGGLWAAVLPQAADAAKVTTLTPQGETPVVKQVRWRFDADMVPQGDPRLPAPAVLRCEGKVVSGNSRWLTGKEWVLDLPQPLAAGQRCEVALAPGWKPGVSGATAPAAVAHSFSTSGPAVAQVWPSEWSSIEEEQHFLVQLTGPVQPTSLSKNVWCEVDGLGERLSAKTVSGANRDALLKRYQLGNQADRVLLLACQRPFAAEAKVRLVWGPGIVGTQGAVATKVPQRFEWTVRKRFEAEFTCERERAEAPCMPLRPLRVRFSSPVPRELAAKLSVEVAGGSALKAQLDKDGDAETVEAVSFAAPLPVSAKLKVVMPSGLKDQSGRPLANAASFPLDTATGAMPPLAKFAAAPFGILESDQKGGEIAMLPITVRHVQSDLAGLTGSGQVRIKRMDAAASDFEILRWLGRVDRFHENTITAKEAGWPADQWTVMETVTDGQGREKKVRRERNIGTREASLLLSESGVQTAKLPMLDGKAGDVRPFEVLGIPLPQPGYHLVEVESRLLGKALLADAAPMYVRTGALVTNLGVHFKRGRENSLVWVTTLDRAKPVADAAVAVSDCRGKQVWSGKTDDKGLARIPRGFDNDQHEQCLARQAWFVSARATDAAGRPDMAFTFSDWMGGIDPWRFNQPLASGTTPDTVAHTVMDRSLFRVGETVHMKHYLRVQTAQGLKLPPAAGAPTKLVLTHSGSGEETELPLAWPAGKGHAAGQWAIPATAKLGVYDMALAHGDQRWPSGQFRVEAFRLPMVDARLAAPKAPQVAVAETALELQLNVLAGGVMAQARTTVSALLKDRSPSFAAYGDFSFELPRVGRLGQEMDDDSSDTPEHDDSARLVLAHQPLSTDANGAARVLVKDLPKTERPAELLAEVSFNDPNGEVQTVRQTVALWPSAVVVGLRSRSWVTKGGSTALQAVVLNTEGKPLAGQAVQVRAKLMKMVSTRKRLVGGFYAYEHHENSKDLGVVCEAKTDEKGLAACDADLGQEPGEIQLVVEAKDEAKRVAKAGLSIWLTGQGDNWFAQDNDDRIDVLAEQAELQPGQTARLQVRMPYREATALVSIEREGILDTRIVQLRGDKPIIELPIPKAAGERSWAPNVYVSVMVLRGRVRDVPWYSFFTWGWRSPSEWWQAWRHEGVDYQAPTAMVDLSKPSFKLGVAALRIGLAEHELAVSVTADKASYAVRDKAKVTVRVTRGGQPFAGASVAFAAVDESLLALKANDSWHLLDALMQPRGWGVETSTAQGEIIGRRHYGKKAAPAGGGGGRNPTRELFDTLLLWRAELTLDANGQAQLEVPLNDSLTKFRLVAVADASVKRGNDTLHDVFGSGHTTISVSQDLQMLAGLPLVGREGDQFDAGFTLRNTTAKAMSVEASLRGEFNGGGEPLVLPPKTVNLAAGAAVEVSWPVTLPTAGQGPATVRWVGSARDTQGTAKDQLAVTQTLLPAVPLRVWSASIQQLQESAPASVAVAAPGDALGVTDQANSPKRGGVQASLQPTLAGAMPGVRRFFELYPFSCLEQRSSRAVGLLDKAAWSAVMADLPGYLDIDGLAHYYPPSSGDTSTGSDRLTAYLLALSDEAAWPLPDAARTRMLDGLQAFVEGRLERRFNTPKSDLDVRKLAALEALSRHGRAQAKHLGSLQINPAQWPTAALIDWALVLRRVSTIPERARLLQEASNLLRSRLDVSGTALRFTTEGSDYWWWLMDSPDSNANRLVLAFADQADWQADMPRLVLGALGRQQRGAWLTTTANAWGTLAMRRFSSLFERSPVTGSTVLTLGTTSKTADWAAEPKGSTQLLPWPATSPANLQAQQQGSGKPWLTVQTLAAVPLKAPLEAGYSVQRSVEAVSQKTSGQWSKGDVVRVRLTINARADMAWVALSDPIPTGATLLGSGLGGDSQIATQGEGKKAEGWAPSYMERGAEAWRGVWQWLPQGQHVVEYTVRLNQSGSFQMPPTRIEGMYAPDSFAERPNPVFKVQP
ncbi:MAG: alpha-2-macroglobulin [Ideonella sp. MAG2]|nr:MAG: alpha-2-macroglobulin [Ideonella sp. MAG2]